MTRIEGGTRGTPDWWAAEWEDESPFYDGPPTQEVINWLLAHPVNRRTDYAAYNAALELRRKEKG